MKTSTDRILTTHTGSLPRSKALSAMLVKREQRKPYDTAAFQAELERNLDDNVKRQIASGVDIGNDGETPRVGFSTYTTERMTGFGGESRRKPTLDTIKFPGFAEYHVATDWRRRGSGESLERAAGGRPAGVRSNPERGQGRIRAVSISLETGGRRIRRELHVCSFARHRLDDDAALPQQSRCTRPTRSMSWGSLAN